MMELDPAGAMMATPATPEERAAELARVQAQPGFAPLIRSWGDLNMWTTDEQRRAFEKWLRDLSPNKLNLAREPDVTVTWISDYKTPGGSVLYVYALIKEALQKGKARIPLDAVIRIVNRVWDRVGWTDKTADWIQRHLLTTVDLARANLDFAGWRVARAMAANKGQVIQAATAWGIRTDISDENMAGALVAQIADAATTQGLTIPQVVEIYGAAATEGAGSILSEFWNDSKDWFLDVVVKNIGRALVWVGEQILKARDNVPYLGTYFLNPLGFSLLAETLRQVGEYFRTRDAAKSFNERVLGFELGTHWTALGQALIVAGGIIAGTGIGFPLGVIIEAIGILLYACGSVILGEMKAREARSRKREEEEKLERMEKNLAAKCRDQLLAEGVDPALIPKDSDKCVKMVRQVEDEKAQEKAEILSADQPAPEAERRTGLVLLTLLGVGYLLTR